MGGLFVSVIWNQGFFLTAGRDAAGLLGIKESIVEGRVTLSLKRQSGGSELASLRQLLIGASVAGQAHPLHDRV